MCSRGNRRPFLPRGRQWDVAACSPGSRGGSTARKILRSFTAAADTPPIPLTWHAPAYQQEVWRTGPADPAEFLSLIQAVAPDVLVELSA